MGLLKETMQAIIRIDWNLAAIRKMLTSEEDKWYRAVYQQKPIEQVRQDLYRKAESGIPLFDRLSQLEIFAYPSNLTLGGRFTAVRKFRRLNQNDIATALDVTPSYVSRIEADKVIPSATIIRFFALTFNISETWIATGHLPQTTEEPAKPLATCKVTPLSGYGYGNGGFPLSFHESEKLRNDYMDSMVKGIDYGDPNGSVTNVTPPSGCEKKLTVAESMDRVQQEIDARTADRRAQRDSH